ncbi:hypothetical protein V1264_001639 [Littorina saxatilis]|uniref:Uncharacterized protein n=1 Tax=Littorina saxatilis TaxID=31220 RepID=A0AAN9GPD5_9CAEN
MNPPTSISEEDDLQMEHQDDTSKCVTTMLYSIVPEAVILSLGLLFNLVLLIALKHTWSRWTQVTMFRWEGLLDS